VELEPANPFTLRTLGQVKLLPEDAPAALPHLRAATVVAADKPINLFRNGKHLLGIEGESQEAEADALYCRTLQLEPVGELAETSRNPQRRLAEGGDARQCQGHAPDGCGGVPRECAGALAQPGSRAAEAAAGGGGGAEGTVDQHS